VPDVVKNGAKMQEIATSCTYCGCGCGLLVQVGGGQVIGTAPRRNHPVSRGKLCLRGWNAHEIVISPQRIRSPLIRRGDALALSGWDEAIGEAGRRLMQIRDKSGGGALAVVGSARFTNEEDYLLMKLARAGLGTNNVDHGAHFSNSASLTALAKSLGYGAMTNSLCEIDEAEVILVTGSDTAEQHPNAAGRIMAAARRGATLIVADPRRHQLAKSAQVFLQPIPGTDLAWIMGLANVILEEGLLDREFIEANCENFDAFAAKVREFPPERVKEITGLPEDDLRTAARAYAQARKAMIFYSTGLTQHATATSNVLALANLALITGHIGREGCGINPLAEHNNSQGACDMGLIPGALPGYQPVADRAVRGKFEQVWGAKLPDADGLGLFDIMSAVSAGRIKGMLVVGNPFLSNPDAHHLKEALKQLEALVVLDVFESDATVEADVVLPGMPFAMKDGTFTSTERRVQRVRKCIEPGPDERPGWLTLCDLLRATGVAADYRSPADVMAEIASLTPIYGGITYARLECDEGLQWPCPDPSHPGTQFLYAGGFGDRKAHLSAVDYVVSDETPDADFPFLMCIGRSYFYWNTSPMTMCASTLKREYSAIFLDYPKGFVQINQEDAKSLGVRDMSVVKLVSRRGELEVNAMVSADMRRGTLFIPFFLREQAAFLTAPSFDPEAKMPAFRLCAVRVEKG